MLPRPLPALYYLNSLFDLELGHIDTRGLRRSADEMGILFALVGGSGDRVLLDIGIPDEYWEYLRCCGIEYALPLREGDSGVGMVGEPWGWSAEARNRLSAAGAQCRHPPLETVRRANSRVFGQQLLSRLGLGVPGARCVSSSAELDRILERWNEFPLVVKPAHSNAGYGFVHLDRPWIGDRERGILAGLAQNGGVVIEPWLRKEHDISSRCFIGPDGDVHGLSHHQCHVNFSGAFYAVLLDTHDPVVARWSEELSESAHACAGALFREGYWGPVVFDSFVYRDPVGAQRLAAIIEINARRAMSLVAQGLREKLAARNPCYFRFIGRRRHRLPDSYEGLRHLLGGDSFNRLTGRGVVLATPLRVRHQGMWGQPRRSGFFLVGATTDDLLAMDTRLRAALRHGAK